MSRGRPIALRCAKCRSTKVFAAAGKTRQRLCSTKRGSVLRFQTFVVCQGCRASWWTTLLDPVSAEPLPPAAVEAMERHQASIDAARDALYHKHGITP